MAVGLLLGLFSSVAAADEPVADVARSATGQRVVRFRQALVIPGTRQAPGVQLVLPRAPVEYAPSLLDQDLLGRIDAAAARAPF